MPLIAIETCPEELPFLNQMVIDLDPTSVERDAPLTLLTSTCEPIAPRYERLFHDDVGRTGVAPTDTTVVVTADCVGPEPPPVAPLDTPLVPLAPPGAMVVEVDVEVVVEVVVGVVALKVAEDALSPEAFVATTLNAYVVPRARPVTWQVSAPEVVQPKPLGLDATV